MRKMQCWNIQDTPDAVLPGVNQPVQPGDQAGTSPASGRDFMTFAACSY